MMRVFLSPLCFRLLIVLALASSGSFVWSQDIAGGVGRTDLTGGAGSAGRPTSGGSRPSVKYVTNTKVVTVTKTVKVTPTTGTLAVAAEPNASLLVEPIRIRGGVGGEGKVPAGERIFIFNDLRPGRYRVAAALEGYHSAEEEVTVIANRSIPVTLDLRPVTYDVNFRISNVQSGEIRYAPVRARRDTSGEIKYDPAGETRIAQFQNGQVILRALNPGLYGVDIRSADVGYQDLLATFGLPGETSHTVALKRLESTKTFSATWLSLDSWMAPGAWRVSNRKLDVNGQGLALPKDESYRYYVDFQLLSDVRMMNSLAATFVLRAQDQQNYYLVQLTGAKSDEPYALRAFVVRNGVSQRMGAPIPIDGFAQTLREGQFFTVNMKVNDNAINVSITDSQTGDRLPLGILTDPNRTFRMGAVGVAARGSERFEIGRFIVCTAESPDCR